MLFQEYDEGHQSHLTSSEIKLFDGYVALYCRFCFVMVFNDKTWSKCIKVLLMAITRRDYHSRVILVPNSGCELFMGRTTVKIPVGTSHITGALMFFPTAFGMFSTDSSGFSTFLLEHKKDTHLCFAN